MGHLLLAVCSRQDPAIKRLETALTGATEEETGYDQVSLLDLDQGPRVGRFRAAIGLGWQARDRLQRVALEARRPVDAVVEGCLCGSHHLLGLGRAVAAVRWRPVAPDQTTWVDRLAADEGAALLLRDAAPPESDLEELVVRLVAALDAIGAQTGRGPLASTGKP